MAAFVPAARPVGLAGSAAAAAARRSGGASATVVPTPTCSFGKRDAARPLAITQALEAEVQYRMGLMTQAGLATSLLLSWKAAGCGAGQPAQLGAGLRRWRLWHAEARRARAPAEEAARRLRARLQA